MSNVKNTGKLPTGKEIAIPLGGIAAHTTTPLAANQEWSATLPYNGMDSVLFAFSTDVAGSYKVEWYLGGEKVNFMGNITPYNPQQVPAFQVGIQVKADTVKFTYINGNTAQTVFYAEIRQSPYGLQESLRSVGSPTSSTNLAGTVHSVIEGREDGTGSYFQSTVTVLEDGKVAQDVNVVGGINATIDSTTPINANIANDTLAVKGKVELDGITNLATAAKQTDLNMAIGTKADPIVTDATQSASLISIMKGLLQEGLAQPSTGTAQTVSLAANVAQTIPANNNGKGRLIFSVSGTIFIGFGFTATASLYSVRIITNGFYEVPPLWSNLSISLFATASSTVNVTTLA